MLQIAIFRMHFDTEGESQKDQTGKPSIALLISRISFQYWDDFDFFYLSID